MNRFAWTMRLYRLAPAAIAAGLAVFFAVALIFPESIEWGVISFAAVIGVAALGLFLFGRRTSSALHITLIASLAALATAGRVLFASVANFQPVTFLVLASGIALGPGTGFMVGATSALVSNFFFGPGLHGR